MTQPAGACAFCGRPLDAHDHDVRFQLPDSVFALSTEEREAREMWTAPLEMPDFVSLVDLGTFVRVILPVHLTDCDAVRYGLWLSVTPETWDRVFREWWAPTYPSLEFDGRVANAVAPWGTAVLDAPAHASVRDPDQIPWIVSSDHAVVSRLLTEPWDADEVRAALPTAR